MATVVKNRRCSACGAKYRTKVKKGKDTKTCPGCREAAEEDQRLGTSESQPNSTAIDSARALAS